MPAPKSSQPPPRIRIESPTPLIDCGRFPSKACVGDDVAVAADIFGDGHDVLRAVVRYRGPGDRRWCEAPLHPPTTSAAATAGPASFPVDRCGRWAWALEAWTDRFASWRDEVQRKVAAGQEDLAGELSEGAVLLREAAGRASGEDRHAPRGRPGDRRPAGGRRPARARAGGGRRAPPRPLARRRGCSARSRSTSSAPWPASAPGTSCSRGRGAGCAAWPSRSPRWPSWASTSSTCRRSTRSASRTARAPTTR